MVVSANFEKFEIMPDFILNFRKGHRVSKSQFKSSKSYGQKTDRVGSLNMDMGLDRIGLTIVFQGHVALQ